MKISASSLRYTPAPDRNESLRVRIQQVLRPGMGYRGAWATLRHEFEPLNPKRVHRLWKELRLNARPRPKKRRKGMPMPDAPTAANQLWSLDFVHDACLNGTKLKILAVVDEFTRECLALEAATSIKAPKVRSILASLFADRGEPRYLRSDNGPSSSPTPSPFGWLSREPKAGSSSRALPGKTESSRASTASSEPSS
jgi:putative transposase